MTTFTTLVPRDEYLAPQRRELDEYASSLGPIDLPIQRQELSDYASSLGPLSLPDVPQPQAQDVPEDVSRRREAEELASFSAKLPPLDFLPAGDEQDPNVISTPLPAMRQNVPAPAAAANPWGVTQGAATFGETDDTREGLPEPAAFGASLESGTPEGDETLTRLSRIAAEQTPGGRLAQGYLGRVASGPPMSADRPPLENAASLAGLATVPFSIAGDALAAGAQGVLDRIPGGDSVPDWARERGISESTPVLGGLLQHDTAIPAALGMLTPGPDELRRGVEWAGSRADDVAAAAGRQVDEAGGLVPWMERGALRLPGKYRTPATRLTPEDIAKREADVAANRTLFDAFLKLSPKQGMDDAVDQLQFRQGEGVAGWEKFQGFLTENPGVKEALERGSISMRVAADMAAGAAGGATGYLTAPDGATEQERLARGLAGFAGGVVAAEGGQALGRGLRNARPGSTGIGTIESTIEGVPPKKLGSIYDDNPAMAALDDVWESRVQREVARVTKGVPPEQAGLVEKILAVTVNNLFTPGTVGINVAGNTVQAATRPLRELLEGRPGVAGADLLAMARQTPEAARRAGRLLVGGSDALKGEGDVAQTMMAGVGRPEAFPGRSGLVLTPIARANQALDEFFRGINGAGAGAAAKAMNLPEDEATAFVADAVATSVFQGPPSRMTKALTDWGSKTEGNPVANAFWKASVYSFFPFIRITEQLTGQAVKVLAAPVTEIGAMLQAGARRDPEAFRKGFAKWTMGTALWGIALERANAGELTGVGTGSYQEEALARNARDAQGNPLYQPQATRIGGRWFPNDFAGPWGMAASDIASFVEGWKDNGAAGDPPPEVTERLMKGLNTLGRQLNRQFYLDDFVTFANAVGEGRGVEAAGRMATDMSKRAVSGLIRPLTERIDPVVRDPSTPLEAVASGVPGLSQSVPPKIDPTTGKPVTRSQDVLSVLFRSPAPGEPNPVAAEVARLEKAGRPVSVRQLPREVEYAGEKQSPEQRLALQTELGTATRTYLSEWIARPEYGKLSDAQKATTLNKALDVAYKMADLEVGEKVNRDPAHKALMAWAQTPQYAAVKGSPTEIAKQNAQVAEAKAKQTEYRKEYGRDQGDVRLYREDREAWKLAQRERLDTDYLRAKRKRIDQQFGVDTEKAERAGLVGAGNSIVPQPQRFTAPVAGSR